MKRSWIGFFLLILLLGASILSAKLMVKFHEPVAETLQQAARYAMEGSWEEADDLFRKAQTGWKQREQIRSCFADHTPVEEIDAEFALLNVWCTARETISFSGGCFQLARQVAAVGEAHKPVWWNLL